MWNLSPQEWSDILVKSGDAEVLAKDLKSRNILPWVETLIHYTRDSETILDLGSGAGQNAALVALHNKKTTLLDWSQDNLVFSKKLYEHMNLSGEFIQADMTRPLPFEDNSFDTVFSCGVFEYFTDEEIKGILKEAFRISKKRVIIMVPNALSIAYRIGYWYMKKTKQWKWGGERPFTTLKPYFNGISDVRIAEFTVAAKHSLNFLTMPTSDYIKRLIIRFLKMKDHAKPALLKQGYLLVAIGERQGIKGD
jgi:SAM-dependent methyltransferase